MTWSWTCWESRRVTRTRVRTATQTMPAFSAVLSQRPRLDLMQVWCNVYIRIGRLWPKCVATKHSCMAPSICTVREYPVFSFKYYLFTNIDIIVNETAVRSCSHFITLCAKKYSCMNIFLLSHHAHLCFMQQKGQTLREPHNAGNLIPRLLK